MTEVPSLSYVRIIAALERLGFVVLRQRGSHIRLMRIEINGQVRRISIPAHKPVLRSTLAHILKDANVPLREFLDSL